MEAKKVNLFTPFKIGKLEIKNRIVLPPMCMLTAEDGQATDWHVSHYSQRAIGGVGLIILEAIGVDSYQSCISDYDLGIWDDKFIPNLSKIVKAVHENGAKMGIQLAHAGRKCESKKAEKIYGPSAIAFNDKSKTPIEMTQDDINHAIDAFAKAAERAVKAGFDLIQIHAAHGYLISTFLSPLTNKRTDEYGKKRTKFLEEILKKIKATIGNDFPIQIRISASDWKEGGNTPKDFVEMLKPLENEKLFDSIDVSSGGVVSDAKYIVYDGYQIPFAVELKQHLSVPIVGGGLIIEPAMANNIVKNGACDAVYLGREMLRNPYWSLQAALALGVNIEFPRQYITSKRYGYNLFTVELDKL